MDDPEFQSKVDITTETILLHASNHDLEALKPFLRVPGAASVQDPETGSTPLHAVIAACERSEQVPSNDEEGKGEDVLDIAAAKSVIRELFLAGAIWNDLDKNGETPGCLAWRLGQKGLYELIVEAGVRAELLLNLLGGYERLEDEDSEDDEDQAAEVKDEKIEAESSGTIEEETSAPLEASNIEPGTRPEVNSSTYLSEPVTFASETTLLDADANGVMMAWEAPLMSRSVELLCPSNVSQSQRGPRVLNIGFGMGLIDTEFSHLSPPPSSHHIVEAHPDVLKLLGTVSTDLPPHTPESYKHFGPEWQAEPNHHLHAGRWQDVLPLLLAPPPDSPLLDEHGIPPQFDAIYFDTFAEDYAALKLFFTEFVLGLMAGKGKMSFFMGCGADRRVCYDVYSRVVEADLIDAGLSVEWEEIPVDRTHWDAQDADGDAVPTQKHVWDGVRRRYFDIDIYRLPICEFIG